MLQDRLSGQASRGVFDEQAADQILGLVGDEAPLAFGKVVATLLDAGEQQILTRLASLAALPSASGSAVAVKRRISAQQNVHDDAKRPQIAALVVRQVEGLLRADESVDHFGRHEFRTADRCQQFGRRNGRVEVRVELDARTEIEITDLDRRQPVGVDAQNVLRLEIPVRDPLLVQELQGRRQVRDHQRSFVLRKVDAPLDVRQQRTAHDLLENQIETILLLKELDQLNYVRVTLAVMERLDLLEDARPAVTRNLFDDLHDTCQQLVTCKSSP